MNNILSRTSGEVEVVVVIDGESTDFTEQVVRERQANYSQLRYLRLPVKGDLIETKIKR